MKRIATLFTMLFVAPCLTGCFSTAVRMSSGGAGTGGPTQSDAVLAGALDAVTFPIQAPFLVGMAASNPSLMSGNRQQPIVTTPVQKESTPPQTPQAPAAPINILREVRNDPEYLFTHRSQFGSENVRLFILDQSIPFTDDQFRRLGATNEWTKIYVVGNKCCPPDVMEAIWNERSSLSENDRRIAVYYLIRNPNTPSEWLAEIARRRDVYNSASDNAANTLFFRNLPPPRPPGSPPVSPSLGK